MTRILRWIGKCFVIAGAAQQCIPHPLLIGTQQTGSPNTRRQQTATNDPPVGYTVLMVVLLVVVFAVAYIWDKHYFG